MQDDTLEPSRSHEMTIYSDMIERIAMILIGSSVPDKKQGTLW